MTAWWGSLPLFAVALVAAIAVGAIVAAAATVLLRRRLLACAPVRRHRALLVLAALPLLIGTTLTLSASLPALISLVMPGVDHCSIHDDGHAHLCFRHVPHATPPALVIVLASLLALAVVRFAPMALRLHRTRRVLAALVASGESDAGLGVVVVESRLPICMAAGLLHPRILIARELLVRLEPEQCEVVLAHERAHLERHDALHIAIARALVAFQLPFVARWLERELGVCAEQACDEIAARRVGDRVAVASTILAMQRAWMLVDAPALAELGPGFAVHALERRVQALLDEPAHAPSFALHGWILLSALLLTLAAASGLHHMTESLVSQLVSDRHGGG